MALASPEMDGSIAVMFLALVAVVAHAGSTPNEYWKTMLPNTPMPSAIRDLFRPDVANGIPAEALLGDLKTTQVRIHGWKWGLRTANSHGLPDEAIFFLEKDLLPGSNLKLDFTRQSPAVAFLPRSEAETMPFSSDKLPAILNHFSVQPNSAAAKTMMETLRLCELKDPAVESNYCANSLESMVDYATLVLRTHDMRAISSVAVEEGKAKQMYVVASSPKVRIAGNKIVSCHPLIYPYAVFSCHDVPATTVSVVPLVGEDGAKMDAITVCHTDTSAWYPKHLAFQMTKVKPGTVPVCHFLAQGGLVWAPRP